MRLPFDVLNKILEFDGRIKYIHKDKIYVNILNKYDYRYDAIQPTAENHLDIVRFLNIGNAKLKFHIDIFYKASEGCLIFSKKKYF
jgi:hypothetical protein